MVRVLIVNWDIDCYYCRKPATHGFPDTMGMAIPLCASHLELVESDNI